jgi:hypothetical protein
VVNAQNEIYHFVNGKFDRLPGTATDTGVGGDRTAWIIGTDSNVYRWTHDNCERMPGTGVAISVDRSGSVGWSTPPTKSIGGPSVMPTTATNAVRQLCKSMGSHAPRPQAYWKNDFASEA